VALGDPSGALAAALCPSEGVALAYAAPEALNDEAAAAPADVWAYGAALLELADCLVRLKSAAGCDVGQAALGIVNKQQVDALALPAQARELGPGVNLPAVGYPPRPGTFKSMSSSAVYSRTLCTLVSTCTTQSFSGRATRRISFNSDANISCMLVVHEPDESMKATISPIFSRTLPGK
jgi:hypothetical protein